MATAMAMRMMKKLTTPVKNNRGLAMMIAILSMVIMAAIAVEVSYDTAVEYSTASAEVNKLKARYAAKAGAELGLLRILIYQKALAAFGSQLGDNKALLDPIWNFPFAWPPSKFMGEDINVSRVDVEQIKDIEKESLMDATYLISIDSEGSKIDINDLGSDSEAVAKATKAQILQIIEQELENNDEFDKKYAGYKFDELINNLTDWIDEDNESRNGGDERSLYKDLQAGQTGDTAQTDFIPPNSPFKTIEELHMVEGMTDDIYALLEKRITVYGIKGINVNYANKEVLMSLDEQLTEEIVNEIFARRNDQNKGGPFKDEEDFYGYLRTLGVNTQKFNPAKINLIFDAVYNFRIKSTGQFANMSSEVVAVTFDVENITSRYAQILDEEEKKSGDSGNDGSKNEEEEKKNKGGTGDEGDSGGRTETTAGTETKMPKGRPTVVYWKENW